MGVQFGNFAVLRKLEIYLSIVIYWFLRPLWSGVVTLDRVPAVDRIVFYQQSGFFIHARQSVKVWRTDGKVEHISPLWQHLQLNITPTYWPHLSLGLPRACTVWSTDTWTTQWPKTMPVFALKFLKAIILFYRGSSTSEKAQCREGLTSKFRKIWVYEWYKKSWKRSVVTT